MSLKEIDNAPELLEHLPAYFDSLGDRQLRTCWVACLAGWYTERCTWGDGELAWFCRSLNAVSRRLGGVDFKLTVEMPVQNGNESNGFKIESGALPEAAGRSRFDPLTEAIKSLLPGQWIRVKPANRKKAAMTQKACAIRKAHPALKDLVFYEAKDGDFIFSRPRDVRQV